MPEPAGDALLQNIAAGYRALLNEIAIDSQLYRLFAMRMTFRSPLTRVASTLDSI